MGVALVLMISRAVSDETDAMLQVQKNMKTDNDLGGSKADMRPNKDQLGPGPVKAPPKMSQDKYDQMVANAKSPQKKKGVAEEDKSPMTDAKTPTVTKVSSKR